MAKNVSIVGVGNINKRLKEIAGRASGKRRTDGITKVMDRLVGQGRDYAAREFESAEFDGEKDVTVSAKFGHVNADPWVITAKGRTVLFIEFGTGINKNPGDHPLSGKYGFVPTSWSATHAGWLVPPRVNRDTAYPNTWPYGGQWHEGSPPSKSMYKTAKYLKKEIGYVVEQFWNPNG